MAQNPAKDHYSAYRASKIAGLSLSMVNYLCWNELVLPSGPHCHRHGPGRGRRRDYSFADLVVLRAIGKLLKHGVSVYRMKAALDRLRVRYPEITQESLPASHLFTDGKNVLFREGREILQDLNSGQYAFAFLLDVRQIQKEVVELATKFKANKIPKTKIRRYGT
ncbi:MAG: MerR family transcriptional regulator [Betaproteobacteria bacterium]